MVPLHLLPWHAICWGVSTCVQVLYPALKPTRLVTVFNNELAVIPMNFERPGAEPSSELVIVLLEQLEDPGQASTDTIFELTRSAMAPASHVQMGRRETLLSRSTEVPTHLRLDWEISLAHERDVPVEMVFVQELDGALVTVPNGVLGAPAGQRECERKQYLLDPGPRTRGPHALSLIALLLAGKKTQDSDSATALTPRLLPSALPISRAGGSASSGVQCNGTDAETPGATHSSR
jgi:hypothetical protein